MIGAPAAVVILALLNGGCACFRGCYSSEDAADLNERIHGDNWQRAEPRMKTTASQLGATLLPVKPERVRYPRSCETQPPNVPTLNLTFAPDPDELCLDWSKEDGQVFRLLYKRAQRRLLVSTKAWLSPYAPLS